MKKLMALIFFVSLYSNISQADIRCSILEFPNMTTEKVIANLIAKFENGNVETFEVLTKNTSTDRKYRLTARIGVASKEGQASKYRLGLVRQEVSSDGRLGASVFSQAYVLKLPATVLVSGNENTRMQDESDEVFGAYALNCAD